MTINYNCDGAGPHEGDEVRVYPLGAGGNLILCKACFRRENQYRIDQRDEPIGAITPDGERLNQWDERLRAAGCTPVYREVDAVANWPLVDWIMAKPYLGE